MKIHLAELEEGPIIRGVEYSPEELKGESEEDLRFEAATGTVTFQRHAGEVLATGDLHSVAHAPCARCLTEVMLPIDVDLSLYFFRHQETHRGDDEQEEFDPEMPDCGFYHGAVIEPDADLRDQIVTDLPEVIVCGEECKGLCPRCGKNLNEGPCGCPPEEAEESGEPGKNTAWKDQLRNLKLD